MYIIFWVHLFSVFVVQKTYCDSLNVKRIIQTDNSYTLDRSAKLSSSSATVRLLANNSVNPLENALLEKSNENDLISRFFPLNKSEFLAGFGLGIMVFAIKKMLLPVILAAQVIKSILIAIFLPSLIAGIGKFFGKGLFSTSASAAAYSTPSASNHPYSVNSHDLAYKEYDVVAEMPNNNPAEYTYNHFDLNDGGGYPEVSTSGNFGNDFYPSELTHRLGIESNTNNNKHHHYTNHYTSHYQSRISHEKPPNYKTPQRIPNSSALLNDYDPFYSPILSRLDAIFQKLKIKQTEPCREKLICQLYANPVKYAPYSNFVSAQLSKELYELRKPTTDSPEVLRFFKYLKAARLGQDDVSCRSYASTCPSLNEPIPALITTYNEINKLVSARNT